MTHQDDKKVTRAMLAARNEGRRCALATIVAARGSTPRKVGARMLVDPDGSLVGTVGGGCGEAEVIEAAGRVLETGRPERVAVDLTDDMFSWSPAVCGGTMDVFVELLDGEARAPGERAPNDPEGGRHGRASRAGTGTRRVRIHYHRPPDRERVFDQDVVMERAEVVVTLARAISLLDPVRVGGRTVLEDGSDVVWFTFPGAWHDIGRFHRADGTFTGFYANVLTPCVMEGPLWRTTDLFLDVWKGVEGHVELLDEVELEAAIEAGWVDVPTAERAREEAERLMGLAPSDEWPPPVVRAWTLARARSSLGPPGSTRGTA